MRPEALWAALTISERSAAVRVREVALRFHELGEPEDDRQQIVEIVGDARRQPPDRVHLARLPDLRLERPPFRDVLGGAGDAIDVTGVVVDGKSLRPDGTRAAVGPDDAVFDIERNERAPGRDLAEHALLVSGVNGLGPGAGTGIEAFATLPIEYLRRPD